MRTIEQAIRHALQKIDAANPALRNKLYQATWQTHEKMLAGLAQLGEEEKQRRREALKSIIQALEAEFQPQAAAPPQPTAAPPLTTAPQSTAKPATTSPLTAEPASSLHADKAFENTHLKQQEKRVEVKKTSLLRGNGFLLVLVAILIFVAWLFYNTLMNSEPATPPAQPAQEVSSAPHSVTELIEQAETTAPTLPPRQQEAAPPAPRNWISILDPADIENIRTRGTATVQLHEEGGERFMRFQAKSTSDSIVIEMGAGLMNRARDKGAIFNFIARSATGQLVQLGVACDIGNATGCGRWRFEVPPMREDLLFGIDSLGQAQPNETLTLSLTISAEANETDQNAAEQTIDIFGLEVSFDD